MSRAIFPHIQLVLLSAKQECCVPNEIGLRGAAMNDSNLRWAGRRIGHVIRIESIHFVHWIPMETFKFLAQLTVLILQADSKAFAAGVDIECQITGN